MTAGKVLVDLEIGSNWSYEGSCKKKTLEGALRKRRSNFLLDIDIFYGLICFKKSSSKWQDNSFVTWWIISFKEHVNISPQIGVLYKSKVF